MNILVIFCMCVCLSFEGLISNLDHTFQVYVDINICVCVCVYIYYIYIYICKKVSVVFNKHYSNKNK